LTHSLPLPAWKAERHESFYYLNIIAQLERLLGRKQTEAAAPRFDLHVSADRKQEALRLLREHGARLNSPLTILCPGSINSRAKRWPAECYAELADRLAESGSNVALIGSPAELDVSDDVCQHARSQPIVLTGKTSVAEAKAIIERVHQVHADHCPVYKSLHKAIEITTSYQFTQT